MWWPPLGCHPCRPSWGRRTLVHKSWRGRDKETGRGATKFQIRAMAVAQAATLATPPSTRFYTTGRCRRTPPPTRGRPGYTIESSRPLQGYTMLLCVASSSKKLGGGGETNYEYQPRIWSWESGRKIHIWVCVAIRLFLHYYRHHVLVDLLSQTHSKSSTQVQGNSVQFLGQWVLLRQTHPALIDSPVW